MKNTKKRQGICENRFSTGVDKAVDSFARSETDFSAEVPAHREFLPVDKLSDFSGIGQFSCINPLFSVDKPLKKSENRFLFRSAALFY
ncbi:MAG: hypothetical protein ACI3XM_12215 [Eubacteriales bacterium]